MIAGNGTASAGQTTLIGQQARRIVFDQRYIAPILISCVLLGANYSQGVLEDPRKTALAIIVAIFTEMALGRLVFYKWPHLASAYVSGISVGILVRSPSFWPYAVCSLITITSKYVLRVKGRHIWNPSNFGIAAMLFLAPQAVASLNFQFDNKWAPMIIIWVLGSIIIGRLKRFHICATYALSFIAFAALRTFFNHDPFWAEVAPITGPMYQLFIFFMITDPKSTVHNRKGQALVAFCVALVECIFRLSGQIHAPYFSLFLVGPIANLIEMRLEGGRSASATSASR